MKVLLIIDPVVPISEYYSVGSTNAACSICKELSNKGLDITLGAYWDTEDCEMSQYVTPLNIHPIDTRLYMKEAFKVINAHLDENSYDSINIHISTPSVVKYLLDIHSNNTPVYFTMHSWTGTRAVSFDYKNEFTQLVNEGKVKLVFLCKSQMEQLFSNIGVEPKNYIIEPNAIPPIEISASESLKFAQSVLPESFITDGFNLTVCRLVKSKHPSDLIDVVVNHNQKLVIIGSPWINDLDYCEEVITKVKNNPDNVVHIDKLSNQEVRMLMRVARSTILFTDIEVCNLTILESCMLGTPVVVGPGWAGVRDSIDNLKDGGIEEIVFPYRSKWSVKLDTIADCIDRARTYRYDISKFPECYQWDHHIDNCYKIVTNSMEFN